jgi:anti-sigma factor RsiW
MNCAEWQEKIALFTGADLPADEALAVEAHLSVCDECRGFERELSETRAMLLSMRTIDEADVATVRSNVLSELRERPRRSVFAWMPYAAAAAVIVLVFGLTMWRTPNARITPPLTPPLPHGRGSQTAVAKEPRALASGGVVARVAKRKPRVKPEPKPETEPTVVTLFTDDPDVVIVWITD